MNYVNCTPHPINIIDVNNVTITIPPSGNVARVVTSVTPLESADGFPLFKTEYHGLEGLPPPVEGTVYIVSLPCIGKGRTDVVSPKGLIRDENGNVIGCEGLTY